MSTDVQPDPYPVPPTPVPYLEAVETHFKKGYKTTEFWIGLPPLLIPGIAWAAKLFGYEVDQDMLIGSLGALVPAALYVLQRGWVKKARNEAVAAALVADKA